MGKPWQILPILKMSTIKIFGDIFLKIFQILRIVYSLYNNLAIFRMIKFYPIKLLGKAQLQKGKMVNLFFEKRHGKIAHVINFTPKIFLRHLSKALATLSDIV